MSIELFNQNCIEGLKNIKENSVNCVLTDPPYLYLKNQKLDKEFDEKIFFLEAKRILKDDGFIVLFGRGSSFYRWNTILDNLGFVFKEEIVWDKTMTSSPLLPISRVHETISIHTKKLGKINKVKIPYLEMKKHNFDSIIQDVKRLKTIFSSQTNMKAVLDFIENNIVHEKKHTSKFNLNTSNKITDTFREVVVNQSINNGLLEKSIIRTDRIPCDTFTKHNVTSNEQKDTGNRTANVSQSVEFGMNEKSIIKETRNHYKAIHPTEKPVRLLERLLLLTTKENDLVLDPFFGSCSTGEACFNLNRNFIGFEIDKEYFDLGFERTLNFKKDFNINCMDQVNKILDTKRYIYKENEQMRLF